MRKYIGFLLCVSFLVLLGAGPSTAQNDGAAESEVDSSLPVGILLENSSPENSPKANDPNAHLPQGEAFVIPESTKGFDEQKVLQDPLCDPTHRPTIQTITPDEANPGDTIRVTGNYFGAKTRCLYSVTFGEYPGENLSLLGDNIFEVRVPKELKAGLIFLNVVTNGGSARSAILIKG
ncbi:MAG: IPT/TIG domain-containing protein [Nitrospirales bacterium]|nr:IPT/TIG domain-containing protein [Nitrospirales bacterium]